jgi:hypothetical protein
LDAKKAIATGRDPETLGLLGAEGLWAPRTQGGSRGPPRCSVRVISSGGFVFCRVFTPFPRGSLAGGCGSASTRIGSSPSSPQTYLLIPLCGRPEPGLRAPISNPHAVQTLSKRAPSVSASLKITGENSSGDLDL